VSFYAYHFDGRLIEDMAGGRYYVAPIVQDVDGYRSEFHGLNHGAAIATGANGAPVQDWALVFVISPTHVSMLADSQVLPLPFRSLDTPVASLTQPERNLLQAATDRTGQALLDALTMAEVVSRLGTVQVQGASFNAGTMAGVA
jgi:hypothetical protein